MPNGKTHEDFLRLLGRGVATLPRAPKVTRITKVPPPIEDRLLWEGARQLKVPAPVRVPEITEAKPLAFPTTQERQAILFGELGYKPAPPVKSLQERQERVLAFRAYRKAGGKLFADQWELFGMPTTPANELPMLNREERQAVINKEAQKQTNLFIVFGKSLKYLPKQLGASILQAVQGQGGASVVDKDWADRFIQDASTDLQRFTKEVSDKYIESSFPISLTDAAQLPQNIAYSLTSMGAGITAGVPVALAPIPGARVAAWGVGSAASGIVAFSMTTYQIMQQYLEAKNEESIAKIGRGLTAEEEKQLKDDFDSKAREYGLWEAVPEAISNLTFAKILTLPLTKIAGRIIATRIVGKLAGLYGEELLTETITQKGQSTIEVAAGLREGNISWTEAFREVAPQTFLLTTILGGSGQVGVSAVNKVRESLKGEIGEKHPLYKVIEGRIEEAVEEAKLRPERGALEIPGEKPAEVTPTPTKEAVVKPTTWKQALIEADQTMVGLETGQLRPDLTFNTKEYQDFIDSEITRIAKKYNVSETILRKQTLWEAPAARVEERIPLTETQIDELVAGVVKKPAVPAKVTPTPEVTKFTTYQGDIVTIGEMVNYGAFGDRGLLVGGTAKEAMVRPIQTKGGVLIGFKDPVNVKDSFRKIHEPLAISSKETAIIESAKVELAIPEAEMPEAVIEEEIPLSASLQSAYDEIRVLRQQKATTEKVKESLVKMIKKHLPLPRQGEWLAKVKNVKTEAQLNEAIARVQEVAGANVEKFLRADIIRELRKTAPRIEKGITVGRLTPEVQSLIERLRASLLVGVKGEGGISRNVEAYEAARTKIEQGIGDYREGKITWDALLETNENLKYTGMYGMSTAQLQEALDYTRELKRLGKDLRKIKREEIKAQRKEIVDKAVVEITDGKGIKPGVGTLRNEDLAGTKKVLDQPVNSQYGFVNLLDKLGKFAKGTKQYQGFLMRFTRLSQNAVNTENMEREGTLKIVRDKFQEIYNVTKTREATRLLSTLSNEDIDLGTFPITTKEGVQYLPIKLTRAEMMYAYQLYKNPKNLETFKEGMHWTPEIMTKIVNTLTKQDIAWADWLQEKGGFYDTYYDKILPFYQQEFNIDMPKNPDYVPHYRDFEAKIDETDEVRMLLQDQKRYASVTNMSLKARQENIRPFKIKSVFTVLTNHIIQMEHFMAWAETMHELRSTFGNTEVRTAIRQYHSNDILKRLDDYMNDFARGGVDRVQFLNILDKLRSNFAVSVLALKPSIGLQQIWTVGAFMTEMKAKDFVTGTTNFWLHPIENYKWMMENSSYIKNRYTGGNYERDIRLAQQQGVAKTMSGQGNSVRWLLWQVTQGDKFGIMPGWWAKYQAGLKEGLSQADAMVEADLASERTQNTSELASLSWLQRGSSWGKLLTMFQSQPNKYFRIIADNIRNMQYGRQSKVKGITNLFIIWALLPMLFQWVADAFWWKKEHQARVLLLGPLNNILAAGQLVQTAWGWFTDDSFDWQASPVLSTVRDLQNFSSKLVKIINQIKDPYEDVVMDDIVAAIEFFSKGIGQVVGAPTPYLIMVERAIRDGDPRELVFSRWALEEPTPDLKNKTSKIMGQLGQVIEDVTDLPADKKPLVYDNKKAFSEVKQVLSKTLPSDVTEKNGFSPQVVAIAQAIMAQDILETIPNKRLFEIIDDILSDNTLNYTFSQYYMDYQDRQKITSLVELKEWDAKHPRYNLGNVTPTQFALLNRYGSIVSEKKQAIFLKLHKDEIGINPRQEYLKTHPKENAQLAVWGQAKLLTKEAYTEFNKLIKELDIPDSAIPITLPPQAEISPTSPSHKRFLELIGK